MHPLVALGLIVLVGIGVYIGVTIPLMYGVPVAVVVLFLIWIIDEEIKQLILGLIFGPISVGILLGSVYIFGTEAKTEAPTEVKVIVKTVEANKTVEKADTNETSFNLWTWLNTKPFAEK